MAIFHKSDKAGSVSELASPAQEPKSSDGKLLLKVKVYSPYENYFDGTAFSISGQNTTGPFDVLPKHHNFICLLIPGVLVIEGIDGEKRIRISRGIMHVKADAVIVFLDV